MSDRRVWTTLALLGAALLLIGAVRKHAQTSKEATQELKLQPVPVEATTAVVGPMETTVLAQGTLAPRQGASARVTTPAPGRLLEVRVVEGQHVTAGQVLAVIDNRPQQYQAELALLAARSDREHGEKEAQIALETARNELRRTRSGARPQEVAQAQQSVIQAQATRDRASQEAARVQYLLDHGVASTRQKQDADTSLAVADSTLESARQQLSLVQAGARPEEVKATELAVSNAEQALALARESGEAKVREAEAALSQLQGAAGPGPLAGASTLLRSPLDGRVAHRYQNPGDMADPAAPVVEVVDSRELDLVALLPAGAHLQVREGQLARLRADGVVGQGRVLSVGQVDAQTNLLSVRISVDNRAGLLRVGAFAEASIVIGTDSQAVLIPQSALIEREGKTLVLVAGSDQKAHQREVSLGGKGGGLVEIRSGVQPGERVIRAGQYALPDGAPILEGAGSARP